VDGILARKGGLVLFFYKSSFQNSVDRYRALFRKAKRLVCETDTCYVDNNFEVLNIHIS
jgi:hypothetical protein